MTNYIHSGNFESIKAFIQDSFGTHTGTAGRTSYNYIDEAKSFGIASSSEPFAIGTMVLPTDSGATFNNHWHWAVSKSKKAMILWTQTTNPLTSGNCAVSAVLAQDTHGIWHVFYYNIKAGADFSADRIVPVDYYYNTPGTDKIAMNILQIGGSAGSPNILSPCFNIDGEPFDELFKPFSQRHFLRVDVNILLNQLQLFTKLFPDDFLRFAVYGFTLALVDILRASKLSSLVKIYASLSV